MQKTSSLVLIYLQGFVTKISQVILKVGYIFSWAEVGKSWVLVTNLATNILLLVANSEN